MSEPYRQYIFSFSIYAQKVDKRCTVIKFVVCSLLVCQGSMKTLYMHRCVFCYKPKNTPCKRNLDCLPSARIGVLGVPAGVNVEVNDFLHLQYHEKRITPKKCTHLALDGCTICRGSSSLSMSIGDAFAFALSALFFFCLFCVGACD